MGIIDPSVTSQYLSLHCTTPNTKQSRWDFPRSSFRTSGWSNNNFITNILCYHRTWFYHRYSYYSSPVYTTYKTSISTVLSTSSLTHTLFPCSVSTKVPKMDLFLFTLLRSVTIRHHNPTVCLIELRGDVYHFWNLKWDSLFSSCL